jgi:hypothetical protein
MDNEALKEDFGDNLPKAFIVYFEEQMKDKRGEPVGVRIWIAKMKNHGAEKVVLP